MIEEEDEIVGNIWKELKAMAGNRVSWLAYWGFYAVRWRNGKVT